MKMVPARIVGLTAMVVAVAGHGALISPPSRNAVDRFLPECESVVLVLSRVCCVADQDRQWVLLLWRVVERGKNPIGGGSCNCGDGVNGCEAGVRESGGGQPCLVRGTVRISLPKHHTSCTDQCSSCSCCVQWFSQGCTIGCPTCTGIGSHTDKSLCPNPTATATLPTHAWTMNRGVTPGSANDSYRCEIGCHAAASYFRGIPAISPDTWLRPDT
jgi:hypothetical protein